MRFSIFSRTRRGTEQQQAAIPLSRETFGEALREIAKNGTDSPQSESPPAERVRFMGVPLWRVSPVSMAHRVQSVASRTEHEVAPRQFAIVNESLVPQRPGRFTTLDQQCGVELIMRSGLASFENPLLETASHLRRRPGEGIVGISSSIKALPGHRATPERLEQITARDFVDDVRRDVEAAHQRGHEAVLVGFSTGALANLAAAVELGSKVSALVMIAPPFNLVNRRHSFLLHAVNIVTKLSPGFLARWVKSKWVQVKRDSSNEGLESDSNVPFLKDIPLSACLSMLHLQKLAPSLVKELRCPVLVVQGLGDELAHAPTTVRMFDRIGSRDKKLITYDSAHNVPVGDSRRSYLQDIRAWLHHTVDLLDARRRIARALASKGQDKPAQC